MPNCPDSFAPHASKMDLQHMFQVRSKHPKSQHNTGRDGSMADLKAECKGYLFTERMIFIPVTGSTLPPAKNGHEGHATMGRVRTKQHQQTTV